MDLQEYLDALVKRWRIIVALGVLGALAGLAVASSMPEMYRSTSSVYVSSQRGETSSELVQGATFSQNLVESFAQLATMPNVLVPVIKDLNLDMTAQQLARSITVDNRLNTVIIDVSVANESAVEAAKIASAVTESLAAQVEVISPKSSSAEPSVLLETVAPAHVSEHAFSPNRKFLVATGLIIGFILGAVYALGREVLDTHVRGEKDLERISDVPLIGRVPRMRAARNSRGSKRNRDIGRGQNTKHSRDMRNSAVMISEPNGYSAESYRRLQTNLEFSDVDQKIRSAVVTSTYPDEGKTTIAINLAMAMAEHYPRVLLVDADLRKPSIADYCQIEGAVGLTSILVGEATFDDAVQKWGGGTVDILTAGSIPPSPNRLLGSDAMANLMRELSSSYDFVVVDSPPLAPVTDALALARMMDGAIVVSRYGSTRRQQLARTLSALDGVSARVFGVVLNRVTEKQPDVYYGYRDEAVREISLLTWLHSAGRARQARAEVRREAQLGAQSEAQPEAWQMAQFEVRPEAWQEAQPSTQPEARQVEQPSTRPDAQPDAQPDPQSEAQFEAQPEAQTQVQSEAQPETRSEAQFEAQPEAQQGTAAIERPEAQPEAGDLPIPDAIVAPTRRVRRHVSEQREQSKQRNHSAKSARSGRRGRIARAHAGQPGAKSGANVPKTGLFRWLAQGHDEDSVTAAMPVASAPAATGAPDANPAPSPLYVDPNEPGRVQLRRSRFAPPVQETDKVGSPQ